MNFDKVKEQFHQAQDYVNKMTPKEKAVGAAAVAGSLLTAIALKKVLCRPPKAKTYDGAEVVSEDSMQLRGFHLLTFWILIFLIGEGR